jgi:hypothetical protein
MASTEPRRTEQEPPMPRFARPLRVIVLLHAALVFAQAAFAGQFLAGHAAWLRAHEANGGILHLVALVQLVVAVLVWRPGNGPAWPAVASLVLVVAEEFQLGFGYARVLALHVPLGVAIFGLTVAVVVGTGRLARAEPRSGGGAPAPARPEPTARGR